MGLLEHARVAALAASCTGLGCYTPELRDCTLACSSKSDCAVGQVCGADRFCAAPEVAGRCNQLPVIDAGSRDGSEPATTPDARADPPRDAGPPDAPQLGTLEVRIDGKGRVIIDGIGTCDDDKCVFDVPLAWFVTVRAAADARWRFDTWKTDACPDRDDPTCTFSPLVHEKIRARFVRDDDDH